MKNQVLSNIWLGSVSDAQHWNGVRLCVLEKHENCSEDLEATERGEKGKHFELRDDDIWIPVLQHVGSEYCVVKSQLEKAARVIDEFRKEGRKLLLHCRIGQERSPLTMAYYLHTRENMSMDEAYRLLQSKRKIVSNRQHWICGAKVKQYRVQVPRTQIGEAILDEIEQQAQVIKVKRKKRLNITFDAMPLQADRVAYLVKMMGGEIIGSRE